MKHSQLYNRRYVLGIGLVLLLGASLAALCWRIPVSERDADPSSPKVNDVADLANDKSQATARVPLPDVVDSKLNLQRLTADLPQSFEPNLGQTDSHVKFLSRGPGYSLFLKPTEAVLQLRSSHRGSRNGSVEAKARDSHPVLLTMKLNAANARASVKGVDQLPGRRNYFIGNDPQQVAHGRGDLCQGCL